ncbi:hypothetical protein HaLaN_28233 [Haematococcus lacustris]|uniref:Uncharacterized protein n=1 Tax=Haematococcus lacustris TaxID=44745 RepID=A0A6A0ABA6_HAELA|nr:hypothetical protein HaLaN_28233 [Haematococcus lacustris]
MAGLGQLLMQQLVVLLAAMGIMQNSPDSLAFSTRLADPHSSVNFSVPVEPVPMGAWLAARPKLRYRCWRPAPAASA